MFAFLITVLTINFQRSILEVDQDKIIEDDGDMNDEELNELIARHKSEVAIFYEKVVIVYWSNNLARAKILVDFRISSKFIAMNLRELCWEIIVSFWGWMSILWASRNFLGELFAGY